MRRYYRLVAILLFALTGCSGKADSTFIYNGVTAHRGDSGEHPENTMRAFNSALSLGVDWIELDIFMSKDSQIVVIHDDNTGRVSTQNLRISDITYEELETIDVAHEFRNRHSLSKVECPVSRVPLLSEVIQLVMKQTQTRLSIQPKVNCVQEAVALIKALKAEKWVGFNDGNLRKMKEAKRGDDSFQIFWDRSADSNIDEDILIAQEEGFESIVINHHGITEEKVLKVKRAGLEVGAWTVNDSGRMKELLDLGVDRIYTDYPRSLLQILKE